MAHIHNSTRCQILTLGVFSIKNCNYKIFSWNIKIICYIRQKILASITEYFYHWHVKIISQIITVIKIWRIFVGWNGLKDSSTSIITWSPILIEKFLRCHKWIPSVASANIIVSCFSCVNWCKLTFTRSDAAS